MSRADHFRKSRSERLSSYSLFRSLGPILTERHTLSLSARLYDVSEEHAEGMSSTTRAPRGLDEFTRYLGTKWFRESRRVMGSRESNPFSHLSEGRFSSLVECCAGCSRFTCSKRFESNFRLSWTSNLTWDFSEAFSRLLCPRKGTRTYTTGRLDWSSRSQENLGMSFNRFQVISRFECNLSGEGLLGFSLVSVL